MRNCVCVQTFKEYIIIKTPVGQNLGLDSVFYLPFNQILKDKKISNCTVLSTNSFLLYAPIATTVVVSHPNAFRQIVAICGKK